MSDHVWVQEHVAAFVAGGLDAQEAERLETHARDCPACSALLAEARQLDGGLSALFAGARPALGLEDRTVARLRGAEVRWPALNARAKWAGAVAAVLLLATIGAVAGSLESGDVFGLRESVSKTPATDGASLESAAAGTDPLKGVEGLREGSYQMDSGSDPMGSTFSGSTRYHSAAERNAGQPNVTNGDVPGVTIPGLPLEFYKRDDKPAERETGLKLDMNGYAPRPGYTATPTTTRAPIPLSGPVGPVAPPAVPANPSFVPATVRPAFGDDERKPSPDVNDPKGTAPPATPPLPPMGETKGPDGNPKDGPPTVKTPEPNPEPTRRIILRSGDMEFEIESFDGATATITKLVLGIKGAFVATVNSDKLPNGKVKGTITVRVPPEHLDALVLDLRRELAKGGELKGVKLSSQDVTKMYTDLESRLKAARTMEQRLIQIIKEGKGEIKQLLEAEKELGIWRTKVEEFEGEIRYYANLAAFSTLTVTLTEKEIKAAAAITERERVQAGVEVEDVDKAYQQVLAAVVEAKGRITKSELKQLSAGQFNATFQFEVAATSGGPIRDRLRMLGRVARLEIDRTVQTENGTLPSDVKPKQGDTAFYVQIYNLANVSPRETVTLQTAVADVPVAYQALRDAVAKTTGGRVIVAQLNEQDRSNISAQFDFEVKRSEEGAVRAALDAAGETLSRQVTRAAESDSVTDSKVLYRVMLFAASRLRPRETATLQVAVTDVPTAYQALRDAVTKTAGRVLVSQLNEQDRQNISAQFDFEVKRSDEAGVRAALDAAGEALSRQVGRTAETEGVTDAKVQYKVTLISASRLNPRETVTVGIEVADVDGTGTLFAAQVAEAKGRQVDAKFDRDARGQATAKFVFEVPLPAASGLVEKFKSAGKVRVSQSVRNPQATEGRYATARIDVTLTNVEAIVPDGTGLWPKVRQGLTISASVLLTSVTWVVFGLCVVLPWAVIGFGGYRIVRRFTQPAPTAPAPATPAPAAQPQPEATPPAAS